ncbi:hypothetical protein O181_041475 [Austropuccinia psidii MF-1]|uniref:N(6)-L-threonylcarbamoyladenine synthase n=1 Tax=Austropuccinia psidii MF-1 TaxID=1389203 RepID=A0A9Q3HH67_9BASI|nr:hypothetical protein [Austropuccinia psidii MF-1]
MSSHPQLIMNATLGRFRLSVLEQIKTKLRSNGHYRTRRRFSLKSSETIRVLGIESSCDDSCASIVDSQRRILSNVRLNQNDLHSIYNGIHPLYAAHAHQINITYHAPVVIGRALQQAGLNLTEIDAIAYTRGPGLAACLAVGATAAKSLAIGLGIPLVAVHHMQAHALTPLLTDINKGINFPFLSLLVSGGHTMLVLVKSSSEFKILANTADKALGLAIDKVSSALGLAWPHGSGSPGSELECFAYGSSSKAGPESTPPLPLALRTTSSIFSFCGLQTATIRRLGSVTQGRPIEDTVEERKAIGRAFFEAAFGQIEMKLSHWIEELNVKQGIKVTGVVVSGGVGSNKVLRSRISNLLSSIDSKLKLHLPPIEYCTDNAAMIAWTGIDKLLRGKVSRRDLPVVADWSIEQAEDEDL